MKQGIGFFCIFLTVFFSLLQSESCFAASTCSRAKSNMQSYQNYNHGYIPTCENCRLNPCECNPCAAANSPNCPPPGSPCNTAPCAPANKGCAPCEDPCDNDACDSCDPCAAVCGTQCGISIVAIGIAIAAVAAAAAIIIAAGNGSASHSQ